MSLTSHPNPRHEQGVYSIDERRELHMLAEIGYGFQRYGLHPHCVGCGEKCKQYNAPGSVIVACARTRSAS
jgi:hypothetical protein